MSATAKVDPDQLEENTLRVTVDAFLLNIQHFYMQVDKRDKVELFRNRLRRRFSWSGFFQQPI